MQQPCKTWRKLLLSNYRIRMLVRRLSNLRVNAKLQTICQYMFAMTTSVVANYSFANWIHSCLRGPILQIRVCKCSFKRRFINPLSNLLYLLYICAKWLDKRFVHTGCVALRCVELRCRAVQRIRCQHSQLIQYVWLVRCRRNATNPVWTNLKTDRHFTAISPGPAS